MLNVINHGAACCVIECSGLRILCDPWLSGSIYYGTWERESGPISVAAIGRCDYIWISHLHPDHYHPESLRAYLSVYPAAQIIIGDAPHLGRLLAADGFTHQALGVWRDKGLACIPNHGYGGDDIDTALAVWDADSAVVNLNDCPYDQAQADAINRLTAGKRVTALLPYTGAGPWPQCFINLDPGQRQAAADAKRDRFLAQFQRYREALHADVAIPFSAGYRLRGPLAELNAYRSIPRPDEVPGATVLPVVGAEPQAPDSSGYLWEDLATPTDAELHGLIQAASARAPKVTGAPLTIDLQWGTSAAYVDATHAPAEKAHETIFVDSRLLHGLLTRTFHWNTAEVGSCLRINRRAPAYDTRTFGYLYRFHI
jgi:UDP-MurNAc hydroxylase